MPAGQLTHTYYRSTKYDTGVGAANPFRKTVEHAITAEQELRIQGSIADGTSDGHIKDLHLGDSNGEKMFFIFASGELTIKFNDSVSPTETITVDADSPFVWVFGGSPNWPFPSDVHELYVSNASGEAVTLTIIAVVDTTVTFL